MRTVSARLALALAATLSTSARAAPIDPAFPGLGGPSSSDTPMCSAAALSGDTLFLAGSLRWAGPLTGGGVPVRAADLTAIAGFPHVNGTVLAATADGNGGWFIGGAFTHVGGVPHANLAHIRANLTVDGWAPSTNSDVITVFATPSEVWFGGTFTSVDGQQSSGLAGVSRETGSVVSTPAVNGLVAALAGDGARLYLGGEFTSVNRATRSHLAALRCSDHKLGSWAPAANAGVYALRCANGIVYAGGNFSSIDGLARGGAAALDPSTGIPRAWDPHMGIFNGYGVRALLAVDDKVYLGGGFLQMGGASRVGLAAVDTATGAVTAWDPQVRTVTPGLPPPIVTSLEMVGADLLVGGGFEQVGGSSRADLARLDTATAIPVLPAPEAPAEARALAASGGNVYVGGRFSTFAPSRRRDLLAVRVSTGELLPWSPDATRDVVETQFGNHVFHPSTLAAMAVDSERVYTVTTFRDLNTGADRQAVSAFARASGAALWSIEATGTVKTLAVLDSVLVVGGDFMPANGLLALDARTGGPATWEGWTSGGPVLALCPTPAGLAVGGTFTSAGGQPRSNLALLDRSGALVPDWDPGANGTVTSLALADSKLYCGGDFTRIGGEPRSHLAALSLDSGDIDAWDPGANAPVRALAVDRSIVYAGGGFTIVGGRPRICLAALDAETGEALRWDAAIGLGHSVLAVAADAGHVFAAGTQVTSGTEPARGFAALQGPEPASDAAGPRARSGRGTLHVEPQPAKSVAQVRLRLPRETDGEIGLYDLTGRRLAVLVPWGRHSAGEYTVELGQRQLQPGIYLVRATTPEGDLAGKLVVVP